MRFTKRISLFLWQATKLPTRSLLRNPSLCRSYIVGSPISSGDVVTGLSYGQIRRRFLGYTAEQFSDDEYECEFEEHKVRVFRLIMKRFELFRHFGSDSYDCSVSCSDQNGNFKCLLG